jgi:hypothetical protein
VFLVRYELNLYMLCNCDLVHCIINKRKETAINMYMIEYMGTFKH